MPPIECVEKGCTGRMDGFEKRLDNIDNVEDGALATLHEKINGIQKDTLDTLTKSARSKVSFKLFIWVVGASFVFTGVCTGALYTTRTELFAAQDTRIVEANAAQNALIQDAINEVRAMRMDLDATKQAAYEAKVSIDAHRTYTEGWGKKKKRE
jgi:hypothetical protein